MSEPPPAWNDPNERPADGPPRPAWGAHPGWGPPPTWGPPPGAPGGSAAPGPGGPPGSGWNGPPGWPQQSPGIVPLRPLSVGEIVDGAVRALRANPRTMVGFSAVAIAVITLLFTLPQALALNTLLHSSLITASNSGTEPQIDSSEVAGLVGAGGLSVVLGLVQRVLITTVVSALLIVAVDGAVHGRSLRPGQLWARVRPRLGSVVGLALLLPVSLILFFVVALLPGLILVVVPGGGTPTRVIGAILLVIGALAGTVGSLAFYLGYWAVAAPAMLLEGLGVTAALRRSFHLVRGRFWRVLGIGLLSALIAGIVGEVLAVPFSLIATLLADTQDTHGIGGTLVRLLITDIGTILGGAVVYPFAAGVSALLFLDLRIRREGLDVDLIRR